jgi:nickel-dependent lactate racemase
MKVTLAYGKHGLDIELPDGDVTVVEPQYIPGLPDEAAALRQALRRPIHSPPLRELVRRGQTVSILFCDITRPMPSGRVLPVLLEELEDAGVRREDITLINATGMHRANTEAELRGMLGDAIVENYRIVTHDAHDLASLRYLGQTRRGHPVWVNRHYLDADVRILTGFIEPHFFAGFSGGPKMVVPGVAGAPTVMANHGADMIAHPGATWATLDGNPIWEEIAEAAAMTQPAFNLNVALNKEHAITAVFAGELFASHRQGCAFVRQTAMRAVPRRFDIVITTNSGYPLDQNVYQSVKGMAAAARVVKPGGTIICAAECADGVPEHGNYRRILQMGKTPDELLRLICSPGFSLFDQWQVQIQAQIQQQARVYLKCELPDDVVRSTHFEPCDDISALVRHLVRTHGPHTSICVLPQGPQTVPYTDE